MRARLPLAADAGLLEQLKASLGPNETFLWRERLLTERLMRKKRCGRWDSNEIMVSRRT